MSIIGALRSYLAGCPALSGGRIKTGWTDQAGDFALFPTGRTEITRCFDGSRLLRCRYRLTVRRFSQSDAERTDNEALLEQIAGWIADQDREGMLPDLEEGRALSLGWEGGGLDSYDETGSEATYGGELLLEYERAD